MLYLPVHSPIRELHSKVLLSHRHAVTSGSSILGRSGRLRESLVNGQLSVAPGDSILEVSSTPEALPRLRSLKNLGLGVGLLDEEALAFRNSPQTFASRRYSPASLKYVDVVFSAGEWHEEGLRNSTIATDSIIRAGNPRLESLKIEFFFTPEEREISQQYGDRFVLIASNAGSYALSNKAFERQMRLFATKGEGEYLADLEDIDLYRSRLLVKAKEQFADLQNQVHFAAALRRVVDRPVVMRPHPAVDRRLFETTVRDLGFDGYIDGRYAISPWARRASLLVHRGCTSSIEATAVGTPALMLPGKSAASPPTEDVSFVATSLEESIELASHLMAGDQPEDHSLKSQALRKWIYGVDGSPSAVITEHFAEHNLDSRREAPEPRTLRSGASDPRRAVRRLRRAVRGQARRGMDDEISLGKVDYLVSTLNETSNEEISCTRIGEELFLLARQ